MGETSADPVRAGRDRRSVFRGLGPALALFLLAAGAPAAAAEPRQVLMLYSFGRHFAPFDAFARTLRAELVRRSPDPLDIHEAWIDMGRLSGGVGEGAFLAYLNEIYQEASPELIVTIGGTAGSFAQMHRATLFADSPLLLAGLEERWIDRRSLTERDAAVTFRMDAQAAAETLLAVVPDARELFVVLGSSPLEVFWREAAEQDLQALAGRVTIEWSTGLGFDEILGRAAALPPPAAVLYGLMIVDGEGVPFEADSAVTALTQASAVPVFGLYDNQLGQGIVGGRLLAIEALATAAAGAGLRLLAGEPPAGIAIPPAELGPPTFDSRQLARFGIAEASLPAGSRVLFREPSAWQRYSAQILVIVAVLLVQTTLIVVLTTSRRRLQLSRAALIASQKGLETATATARELTGRLIRAQEEERSRLGRELHDDITQRLAALAIEAGQRERQAGSAKEAASLAQVRAGLAKLSEDVHALSYRLHPSIIEHLGLAAALENEAERIAKVEGLPVAVDARDIPDDLPGPVALCLFRVAQEALRNAVRHAQASQARVTVTREGPQIRLTVEDDGIGFAPEVERRRPTLGLASMAERLGAFPGGTFSLDSAPGRTTRIEARIRLGE